MTHGIQNTFSISMAEIKSFVCHQNGMQFEKDMPDNLAHST